MLFLLLSLYVCFSACSGCMNFFLREIFHVWIFFLSSPFSFPMVHPLKLNGPWKVYRVFSLTWPESMLIYWNKRKSGRRFIVLGHQYGRRDVMWKHSITRGTGILGTQWTRQEKGRINARDKHARKDVLARPSSFARLNFSLSLALWNAFQADNLGTR